MSLMKIKKIQSEKGFTIVELLIVIVVIAILAAITIVAYNGIQNRAKASQYASDANAIDKKAEAFNIDPTTANAYPTASASFSTTASDLSALPSNVAVVYTSSASTAVVNTVTTGTTNPTNNTAVTSALYINSTTGLKTYTVKSCGSGAGLLIFYPDPTNSAATNAAVKTISAGTTTGC